MRIQMYVPTEERVAGWSIFNVNVLYTHVFVSTYVCVVVSVSLEGSLHMQTESLISINSN